MRKNDLAIIISLVHITVFTYIPFMSLDEIASSARNRIVA